MMEQAAEQDFGEDFEAAPNAAQLFVAAKTPIAAPPDRNSRRDFIRLLLPRYLHRFVPKPSACSQHSLTGWLKKAQGMGRFCGKILSSPDLAQIHENNSFPSCRLITTGSIEFKEIG
jgi:hypothetical protein